MKLFLIASAIILSCTSHLLYGSEESKQQSNLGYFDDTPSKITFRHREHEGVGYKTGYSTLEAFLTPNWNRSFQPYADVRGHLMNGGQWASNIGLGARGAVIENLVVGGNFYFDYRQVSQMPCYQVGSGIELLSPYVDFRLNGYLPVGTKTHLSRDKFKRFKGHHLILKRTVKASLASVYAEVGGWIPKLPRNFQLYVAAGPYYLGPRQVEVIRDKVVRFGNKWGGKYRIAARIFDYFDGGIEITHDPLFHTNVQGYLGVSLPLGFDQVSGSKKQRNKGNSYMPNTLRKRMTQSVHRNEIIPVYKGEGTFNATRKNGKALNLLFVNASTRSGGDGTFENPLPSVKDAMKASDDPIINLVKQGNEVRPEIIEPKRSDRSSTSPAMQVIREFFGLSPKKS